MAERVGFEPTEPVKAQQFSRLPDSTTLAPLRELNKSLMPDGCKFQVGLTFRLFDFLFARKNFCIRARHSPAKTPDVISIL